MKPIDRALTAYIGFGTEVYPKEDKKRLFRTLGRGSGEELLPRVLEILADLEMLGIGWENLDLETGARAAVQRLAKMHPEIGSEGTKALEWLYSWWWR